ncbi:MAG: hypothetical protein JWR34_7439 [Mycobacterium sp.]|nr:hypothetical protein [Mycobacterium sp.]
MRNQWVTGHRLYGPEKVDEEDQHSYEGWRSTRRADYEHTAIMRGDAWLGTFGHYQPSPWWRV